MPLLLIDNYDSFTHILAHGLIEAGFQVSVHRNDQIDLQSFESGKYSALCISPGPGTPSEAGVSPDILKAATPRMPVLGICLGMQLIAEMAGGEVRPSGEPVHGHTEQIRHRGSGLFFGLNNPTPAARYHSLIVTTAGREMFVDAETDAGLPMSLRHQNLPLFGLQFHPESFLTPEGGRMLENFYRLCQDTTSGRNQ